MTKRSAWKTIPPQYNPRAAGLLEHDPQPRGAGKLQQKLNKVRFESRPRKRQRPVPEDDDPIIVAYSDEEEVDPIIIVAGLEGDEQKDQEEETYKRRRIPSVTPGRRERKFALCLHPKITTLPPT